MSRELTIDYRTNSQDGCKVVIDDPVAPEFDKVIGIFDVNESEHLIDTFRFLWTPDMEKNND